MLNRIKDKKRRKERDIDKDESEKRKMELFLLNFINTYVEWKSKDKKTNKYLHEKNNNKVFNYILSTCIIKTKKKWKYKKKVKQTIKYGYQNLIIIKMYEFV